MSIYISKYTLTINTLVFDLYILLIIETILKEKIIPN